MTSVSVNTSKPYNVFIGSGILSSIGKRACSLGNVSKICVVSESNVHPLYGSTVEVFLQSSGFDVVSFVFPAGEASKNGDTFLRLLDFLSQSGLTRTDLIVALGGGVVGDLAGFAAATFLRGIRLIQVPTTLLAAVDSSVGGKTAIDLPSGKNLAGAFFQPSMVICDIECLNTLPISVFEDGCAETIKYGILYDGSLFSHLEENGLAFDREAVISRCVELKRDVVCEDEFDTASRMRLNLGHTIGHGVEACSHFTMSHGRSVAVGIAVISRAAMKKGLLSAEECHRIESILNAFGLPTETAFTPQELIPFILSDKKRSGNTVKLIVPRKIGQCDILPIPVQESEEWIQMGIEK